MYFQHLFVRDDLLALAVAATISGIDVLASPRTLVTCCLDLLNHRPHLPHDNLHTTAVTAWTTADGTVLAALSFTFGAKDVTCQGEFCSLALVQLL